MKFNRLISVLLGIVQLALFLSVSVAQTPEPSDDPPAKSIRIYLDRSATVVNPAPDAPNKSLRDMLGELLSVRSERFDSGLLNPKDEVHFKVFSGIVEPFGSPNPISAKDTNLIDQRIETFADLTNPSDQVYRWTDFGKLFDELSQDLDEDARQSRFSMLVIASDLIHDPEDAICGNRTILTDDDAQRIVARLTRLKNATGAKLFALYVQPDPLKVYTRSGYRIQELRECFSRIDRERRLATALEDVADATVVSLGEIERDVGAFLDSLLEAFFEDSLPNLSIDTPSLQPDIRNGRGTFEVINTGKVINRLREVRYYIPGQSNPLHVESAALFVPPGERRKVTYSVNDIGDDIEESVTEIEIRLSDSGQIPASGTDRLIVPGPPFAEVIIEVAELREVSRGRLELGLRLSNRGNRSNYCEAVELFTGEQPEQLLLPPLDVDERSRGGAEIKMPVTLAPGDAKNLFARCILLQGERSNSKRVVAIFDELEIEHIAGFPVVDPDTGSWILGYSVIADSEVDLTRFRFYADKGEAENGGTAIEERRVSARTSTAADAAEASPFKFTITRDLAQALFTGPTYYVVVDRQTPTGEFPTIRPLNSPFKPPLELVPQSLDLIEGTLSFGIRNPGPLDVHLDSVSLSPEGRGSGEPTRPADLNRRRIPAAGPETGGEPPPEIIEISLTKEESDELFNGERFIAVLRDTTNGTSSQKRLLLDTPRPVQLGIRIESEPYRKLDTVPASYRLKLTLTNSGGVPNEAFSLNLSTDETLGPEDGPAFEFSTPDGRQTATVNVPPAVGRSPSEADAYVRISSDRAKALLAGPEVYVFVEDRYTKGEEEDPSAQPRQRRPTRLPTPTRDRAVEVIEIEPLDPAKSEVAISYRNPNPLRSNAPVLSLWHPTDDERTIEVPIPADHPEKLEPGEGQIKLELEPSQWRTLMGWRSPRAAVVGPRGTPQPSLNLLQPLPLAQYDIEELHAFAVAIPGGENWVRIVVDYSISPRNNLAYTVLTPTIELLGADSTTSAGDPGRARRVISYSPHPNADANKIDLSSGRDDGEAVLRINAADLERVTQVKVTLDHTTERTAQVGKSWWHRNLLYICLVLALFVCVVFCLVMMLLHDKSYRRLRILAWIPFLTYADPILNLSGVGTLAQFANLALLELFDLRYGDAMNFYLLMLCGLSATTFSFVYRMLYLHRVRKESELDTVEPIHTRLVGPFFRSLFVAASAAVLMATGFIALVGALHSLTGLDLAT